MKTPDELMARRIQCIVLYPQIQWLSMDDQPLKPGDILMQKTENSTIWRKIVDEQWTNVTMNNPLDYPQIFQELFWFEERKSEDMPKYLRADNNLVWQYGAIVEVDQWVSNRHGILHPKCGPVYLPVGHFYPATREDYLAYKDSLPKSKARMERDGAVPYSE